MPWSLKPRSKSGGKRPPKPSRKPLGESVTGSTMEEEVIYISSDDDDCDIINSAEKDGSRENQKGPPMEIFVKTV